MKITRHQAARKLADYLQGRTTLETLVDWAESALMDGEFPEKDADTLAQALARLGVGDVRALGLTWEDCQEIFRSLGLTAKIDLVAA